jgi:hypothetical protein
MAGFTARLKSALVGDPDAPFLYLANAEVEEQWADGEPGLPQPRFDAARRVVNRMDELAVALAGPGDVVALKGRPDPGYLDLLAGLGLRPPQVAIAARPDADRSIVEDLLADPAPLADLGVHLLPHGVSRREEELAERTGLRLAAPPAAICKAVNSKLYSRRIATELGLRQPAGRACGCLAELAEAVAWARAPLAVGGQIVVKDAYGVSGRGMVVVTEPARLDRLYRMAATRAGRTGDDRIGLVVEEWVPKQADLNYQFTIGTDGTVRFDFVKEAITDRGVHKGHRMPARLGGTAAAEVRRCAALLGARLAADGYYGVVGVDAMTDPAGGLYPVIEINARNNMSTYQATLEESLRGPDQIALARHYPLRLAAPVPFDRLRHALGGLLLDRPQGTGLVVHAFATVNAAAGGTGAPFPGRLYGFVLAGSHDEADALDAEVTTRLSTIEEG